MWGANWTALKLQGLKAERVVPGRNAHHDWSQYDGLVVGGGDDIDFQLYGGLPTPNVRIDPARDKLELEAIEAFCARGKPILGVCRGSQMMNVALGGSLHQDIHDVYVDAPRMRTVLPRKRVELVEGSFLQSVLGKDVARVNALHRQAVDRLGEDLRVAARDEHGIVQAIEGAKNPEHFIVGVQWHPEFLIYRPSQWRLWSQFASAARQDGPPLDLRPAD